MQDRLYSAVSLHSARHALFPVRPSALYHLQSRAPAFIFQLEHDLGGRCRLASRRNLDKTLFQSIAVA